MRIVIPEPNNHIIFTFLWLLFGTTYSECWLFAQYRVLWILVITGIGIIYKFVIKTRRVNIHIIFKGLSPIKIEFLFFIEVFEFVSIVGVCVVHSIVLMFSWVNPLILIIIRREFPTISIFFIILIINIIVLELICFLWCLQFILIVVFVSIVVPSFPWRLVQVLVSVSPRFQIIAIGVIIILVVVGFLRLRVIFFVAVHRIILVRCQFVLVFSQIIAIGS